jgi:other hect domain ubiquitin protein ligase E3
VETPDKPRVTIDRLAAATALESGEDSERHSVLVQVFRQIGAVHPSRFLAPRPSGSNAHTAFEVNFKGENAEGQGGPYRQFFSDLSRELQLVTGMSFGVFTLC